MSAEWSLSGVKQTICGLSQWPAQHAHLWVRTVRMNAATAGQCLRPGPVMRLIVRSTAGSTSGR
jgi:hypothetical protein